MAYGQKIVNTCAQCGKVWESLASQARQCCGKECSTLFRIAKATATKANPEVKAKIRASRIEKFGSWNSATIMQKSADERRVKNGGQFFTEEQRAKLSATHKALGRTTEERKASSAKIDREAATAKSRETRVAKNGAWLSQASIEKKNATLVERYGSHAPVEFARKREATMKERYGYSHALQVPGKAAAAQARVDKKLKQSRMIASSIARYGVANPMQSREVSSKSRKTRDFNKPQVYHDVKTVEWWDKNYRDDGNSLESLAAKFSISTSHLGLVAQALNYPITNFQGSSYIERRFSAALEEIFSGVVTNSRKIIAPKEIDVFIPAHNLAIEVNGLFWHSEEEGEKAPNYHQAKMMECQKKGIQLLQFWDSELITNFDLCISMVKAKAGLNSRVAARKTSLREVRYEEAHAFFASNHLGGWRPGKCMGLYDEGVLVAAMITGPSFFQRECTELIRFASLQGITVVGGFSKLLATVEGPIISYSNNRYSEGGVYGKNGFTLTRDGAPTPWFTKDCMTLHHRSKIIKKAFPELTQRESARKEGYLTVWDAGQKTWRRE